MIQLPEFQETEIADYILAFRRAFGNNKADYVILDSRRQEWLARSIHWGMMAGLLRFDEDKSDELSEEQYTAYAYRLTDSGREALSEPLAMADIKRTHPCLEVGEACLLSRDLAFKSTEWHDNEHYSLVVDAGTPVEIVKLSGRCMRRGVCVKVKITGTPFTMNLVSSDLNKDIAEEWHNHI